MDAEEISRLSTIARDINRIAEALERLLKYTEMNL